MPDPSGDLHVGAIWAEVGTMLALSCNMLAHFFGPKANPHWYLALGGRTVGDESPTSPRAEPVGRGRGGDKSPPRIEVSEVLELGGS